MTRIRAVGAWAMLAGFCLLAPPVPALAQNYPSKAVKLITQGSAGSGPDVIARIVGDALGRIWNQQVVILNQSGAGGSLAARVASQAPADGYTLYMPASSAFVSMPEMFPNLPFDLERDFVRIGFVGEQPMIIAVAPTLPAKTLSELVALSKTKPEGILYSANTRGTFPQLTVERLAKVSGGHFTYVPYPGAAAGLQDLMGGRISMISEGPSALAGAIRGGKNRPIAVASEKRLPTMPDVPTAAETYPGFVATGWFAMLAPAHTPDAIVHQVNADLQKVLSQPDVQKRFEDLGTYTRAMSPDEVATFIHKEQDVWRPFAHEVGVQMRK
jgi:tripartite-type tricarboxylate transporter receptor subunit TctC